MKSLQVSRHATFCLATLAIVVSLAMPAAGRAQGIFGSPNPAPTAQQDSSPPRPQAIALSDIPLRAEEAHARLNAYEMQFSADPDLVLIENDLPDELAAVSREYERLGRMILEHLSLRDLWNLTTIWQAHEETLSGWSRAFDDEVREVGRVSELLDGIEADWRLTAESVASEVAAPQQLVATTNGVLSATDSLDTIIRGRLTYLLTVKSNLDEGLEGVHHGLTELETARTSVRGRLLIRNVPPLWQPAAFRGGSAAGATARLGIEERDAISAFSGSHSGSFLLSAVLFVVFALLVVRLRKRLDELDPTDPSLKSAADMLHRPVSAAFLLTVLASNFMWPRAPFVLWQMIALLAIVPLYRLLPRSSNRVINRTVRVLLVLFAAIVLMDLLVPQSVQYRLLSALTAGALGGASAWLLRGADREQMRQTGWGTVVWHGLQVSFTAGVISFLANVFGWTLVAETLLGGLLYAAAVGLLVVIGYRLIAGMVRLLPHTKIGQQSRIVRSHGDLVTSRAIRVLKLVSFGVWIYLALESFEIIEPVGRRVSDLLTRAVHIGAIEFTLEQVLSFVAVVLLTVWIARFVAFVLDTELLPRLNLKRGVSNAISTVVRWAILGVGLLTAAGALGLKAGQLAIVVGALSVGIGFGLQNIVSNFVSGLILIFEQPVKVGDKIEITSLALTGEVRRIGIRASVVRTFDGAEVIVPNSNLISSEVVNWTLSDQRRRVRVEVGVAYGTDPHRVIEILKNVAVAHPEVLKYPEPSVIFLEFAQSSLNFRLMFWTATFEEFFRVRSEIFVAVNDALKEAGITIPFPQRDLHVKSLPTPGSAELPSL